MNYFIKSTLALLSTCTILLSGCSSIPTTPKQLVIEQDPQQRIAQLAQLKQWKVQGKIAFFENGERNSATLTWQVDEKSKTQQLNLTSYLGINVLQLDSNDNSHKIQVDGNTYQGQDLEALIHSLTGFTLPAQALSFWLKGIPYQESDHITYQEGTRLPQRLTSYYNNQLWHVNYGNYRQVSGYNLPTKFSINKDDLSIKIAINKWSVN
jgi:outer membrane lipoprotein LolB